MAPNAKPLDVYQRNMRGIIVYFAILLSGYISFRVFGCRLAGWECNQTKDIVSHYSDVLAMFCIGAVVFATGPTCDSRTIGRSVLVFFSTLWCFAAIGQMPWMQNALGDSSSWQPPSVYLYGCAIGIIASMLAYGLGMGCSSRGDALVTTSVLLAIVAVYGIAIAVVAVPALQRLTPSQPTGPITLHIHHYSLAWNLCLLFRAEDDPPTTFIRWLLLGVFVQGMSAYGPAGTLVEAGPPHYIATGRVM